MSNPLDIAGIDVGPGRPAYVIAEIGVNHDGSVARAIELVAHARDAGADAIKLQLFTADRLVHASAGTADYQRTACGATDQIALLKRYELSVDEVERIIDAATVAGLTTIATPFSVEDVFVIEQLALPAIKIASPDIVNKPLLERAARGGAPLLVSTGAANIEEVEQCAGWLRGWGVPFAFLHCVSSYPTPIGDARLAWIDGLRARFDVPVGYSDHTTEPLAGAFAVASGACIIEKHLTWNRFAEGPDHRASADPHQFAVYVNAIRAAERMRGATLDREVLPIEADVRRLSRQSLVLTSPISAGTAIDSDSMRVQRPGTGIPACEFEHVVGRVAARDLAAGTVLSWEMLAA